MQKIGLDAFEEALRASRAAVKIDVNLEAFFEEELEVHETGQGWRGDEFDEEIQVVGIGLATCRGAEKPEIFDAVGVQIA